MISDKRELNNSPCKNIQENCIYKGCENKHLKINTLERKAYFQKQWTNNFWDCVHQEECLIVGIEK